MTRPAHGARGIKRHDLADHHPIEQMAQGREAQFRGRCGARPLQLLNIGGDMHALDGRELRHAVRVKPVEEFDRRARIGAARVRVADIGDEEFPKAGLRTLAGCSNERGRVGRDGNELVHCFAFRQATNRRQSSLRSTLIPMKVGLSVSISFD
jgi:hypothetical protein